MIGAVDIIGELELELRTALQELGHLVHLERRLQRNGGSESQKTWVEGHVWSMRKCRLLS